MRLAVANVVLAAFLAGIIWLVQLVVYPMFLDVGPGGFPAWETEHSERITPVVGVPILGQLAVAAALLLTAPAASRWLVRVNLGLVVLALAVTGLVSVPLHDDLARGFSAATIDDLVQTNWVRTVAWTAQLAVAIALLISRVADADRLYPARR